MKIFNPFAKKNEKLINLLSKARVGFAFNKQGGRTRLLSAIEEQQMSLAEQRIRELTRKSFLRRHKYASAGTLLVLVMVGTGSFLAQADISNPGDRFHGMDQFGERMILKLPLTDAQRTQMQVNVVDERNRELDHVLQGDEVTPVKTQAIKESQKALNDAVEKTRSIREASQSKSKAQTEKIDEALARLEALAAEQEKKVQYLREHEKSAEIQKQLDEQIDQIKKARERTKWNSSDKNIDN
jgi:hypothetical protein